MKKPLEVYLEKIDLYTLKIISLKQKVNRISWLRFAMIFGILLIEYFQVKKSIYIPFHALTIAGIIGFIFLVRYFNRLNFQLKVLETYLEFNKNELDLVQNGIQDQFDSGHQFIHTSHPFSFDLDIFGDNSLYQRINRANTYLGQEKLATWFGSTTTIEIIKARQEAIEELAKIPEVYQEILVYSKLGADNAASSKHFNNWQSENYTIPLFSKLLSYLLPALGLGLTILLWITGDNLYFKWATLVFVANIAHFNRFRKRILEELGQTEKISETIQGYSRVLALIEQQSWKSRLLQELQAQVRQNGMKASESLNKLSIIFQSLESVYNGFAMAFFNGTVQFHLHSYNHLLQWKKVHAVNMSTWVETMANFETLISLANFHFNYPETTFPELNTAYKISFVELGHPLLRAETRISNSIDFSNQSFTILTGSNMSGKSTFLRTVGIGIVLANSGAPVPSKSAQFTPIHMAASMRLTDSLSESTSYFYAEVKRLEFIMDQLQQGPLFVLLDEILRGTNSDDKKTGTIGVIEKIIQHHVFGLIATHDLEVCETANKHPEKLINRCFEVDFMDEDLFFDYKLRDGICKNKSATFIMKKHGVI